MRQVVTGFCRARDRAALESPRGATRILRGTDPAFDLRLITVSVAAVIATSAVAPASAATRHKRAVPAQAESSPDVVGLPIHPAWSPIPSPVYQAPNGCFTDEGYGRYTSCEQGGF